MAMIYQAPIHYNPIHQIKFMRATYPQFKVRWKSDFEVEFVGSLRVSERFPTYTVSILYRSELSPIVRVLKPELVEKPPHFYHNRRSLCLYHPLNFKWLSGKILAKEIVPWTAAWIYFYEIWLKTNVWYGPEVPHTTEIQQN
jgi:hypothetical protein